MVRVTVLGGTIFVGRAVVESLVRSGHEVTCLAMTRDDSLAVLSALPDVPLVMLSSVDVYPSLDAFRRGTVTSDVPIDEDTPVRSTRYPHRGIRAGMDDDDKLDCEPLYLDRGGVVLRLPFVTRSTRPGRSRGVRASRMAPRASALVARQPGLQRR